MPNYYDDGEGMDQTTPNENSQESSREERDPGDAKTAMIPKSVTGGKNFEVGDEITLEVVAVHEDELQVRYATGKGEKEEKNESEPSMSGASEKNNSMAFME